MSVLRRCAAQAHLVYYMKCTYPGSNKLHTGPHGMPLWLQCHVKVIRTGQCLLHNLSFAGGQRASPASTAGGDPIINSLPNQHVLSIYAICLNNQICPTLNQLRHFYKH